MFPTIQPQADDTAVEIAISGGLSGIRETLRIMRRIVRESKKLPLLHDTARAITAGVSPKNWLGEAAALHAFVRDDIRYTMDTSDIETLQMPDRLLRTRAGDCDDKATLLATLLESLNHPTRFIAVGFAPDDLSHVLVETKIGNEWIPLETTENVAAGWFPPDVKNWFIVHN